MAGLTTGRLAKQAGINAESIRYYERRGLLARPPRTAAGYRLYPDEAVRRIRFIKRAQAVGFTLTEIRELLDLHQTPGSTCADVRRSAEAKVAEIEHERRELANIKRALAGLIAGCQRTGSATECEFLIQLGGR